MVAIIARRAAQNGRSSPLVGVPNNLGPVGQKASRFVTPGIRVLEGQYIDDLGRPQPWRAFYDEYGRMIGRTDYNSGSRAAGIPDTHYERWEYNSHFPLGRKVENHRPGEFPQ
jgi:YD repeat-containing protein